MSALLDGLRALGAGRLAAMAAVALSMFGFLAILAVHGGGAGHMALLYADLDLREAAQMAEQLDAQHIAHESGAGGAQLLVAEGDVDRARLLLARQGLPSGGSIGYEIFDRADGLTASQFQEQINQTRAMEGELARTIRGISGVRAVRVHLVLPRREPFAREQQEAQASIMLTMAGAGRLDREGVQAVLNLVAAAVPGLRPKNIAIVDSRGDVLARAGEPAGEAAGAQGLAEVRQATEARLARAVEDMLERSIGPGRVRAEAAVDMDFAQVRETDEKYDPDGKVERSTQSVTDNNRTTEAASSVSVQNNLPNADAGAKPGAGSQQQRQEETTNYEIGKSVRTLVRDQPEIRRISLAVLVDGVTVPGLDGKPAWTPRSPAELAQIATLVRGAIGFDEKRGDKVEVVTMRFANDAAEPPPEPRRLFGIPLDSADLMRLAQTGLFGLLALLAMLLVLRPMVLRLTAGPDSTALAGGEATALAGPAGDASMLAIAGPGGAGAASSAGQAALPGGGADAAPALEDESMVNLVNIEGQIRASSIRKLARLVDRHPDESLSIVRSWMQREAG